MELLEDDLEERCERTESDAVVVAEPNISKRALASAGGPLCVLFWCGERASLAAVYGPAFTGWAEALPHSPSLAGVAGTGSESRATKVVGNVSLASPISPVGGNALG